jgi:short-subunit dehydrogenase
MPMNTTAATPTRSNAVQRYGPWAVVTGASDGIGRAFAVELARRGLHLVLVARREARLQALADELSRSHGIECRVVAVDLGAADALPRLAEQTQALDVGLLVAAAGFGSSGPLVDGELGNELEMVDLNCRAVLGLSWHYARRFKARGRGGLVLLSSLVAFQGVPRAANYAATKAYVQTLAEGLHAELKPFGVDVLASAPGPVASAFAARAGMRMSAAQRPEVVARASLDALGRRTTLRPGALSKLLGWSLAMLPRWAMVRVIAQVMKGMTTHPGARGDALPDAPRF